MNIDQMIWMFLAINGAITFFLCYMLNILYDQKKESDLAITYLLDELKKRKEKERKWLSKLKDQ
jgi:hypothetical protein